MNLPIKTSTIFKVAAFVGAITVIAGGYSFFINNIWKPKVVVEKVDFENGVATILLPYNRKIDIFGSSDFSVGGDWAIRFGTTIKNGKVNYERIELVKKGMVVKLLAVS